MTEKCILCKSIKLLPVYQAETTQRGLTVYICDYCSLVQSLPRISKVVSRNRSISSGANFGNIRYGKKLRAKPNVEIIRYYYPVRKFNRILDIGASRGDFARELINWQQNNIESYDAIEPDERLVSDWEDILNNKNIKLLGGRFENVSLVGEYDLIYCSHTLEHLENPISALSMMRSLLNDNGLIFFEVPNIRIISNLDMTAEFFIDKHLYHFDHNVLAQMLSYCGYFVDVGFQTNDHIIFVGKKGDRNHDIFPSKTGDWTRNLIETYKSDMSKLSQRLENLAGKINSLSDNKIVAIWGAGRTLDAVCNAGLDIKQVYIVDDYIPLDIGYSVSRPDTLLKLKPDVIFIMSVSYRQEIFDKAKNLLLDAEILHWSEPV